MTRSSQEAGWHQRQSGSYLHIDSHDQSEYSLRLRNPTRRQDGIKAVCSVHAQVGDGEGPAVELVRGQLLGSRPLHQIGPAAADLVDVCFVRILQPNTMREPTAKLLRHLTLPYLTPLSLIDLQGLCIAHTAQQALINHTPLQHGNKSVRALYIGHRAGT